jgi:hypothetical protein
MPDKTVKTIVVTAACGLSLLGGVNAFAQSRDVADTERVQYRNTDLSGGFYNDRDTTTNWFYDYYDTPTTSTADRTDPVSKERLTHRRGDDSFLLERDRLSDAARPVKSIQRRSLQDNVYRNYYDESWFYEPRDPAYGMPASSAWNDSFSTRSRDEEFIRGTIQAVKQVRNRTNGGQNTVALVRMADGRRVIADLGPSQRTLDFGLTQDDNIKIWGQRETIGPYSVLMAHDIQSGANRARLDRVTNEPNSDYRIIDGRIEQFRDIRVRSNGGELHRTAAVRTSDGRLAIVDIGPSPAENVPGNAAPGDRMTASGPVVQVGNYPVLLADRLAINNSIPVKVVRSDAEYVEPSRRPFEASQEERNAATDPTCIGGGCEAGSVNRSTPRNPLSNAMDGDIGSERR